MNANNHNEDRFNQVMIPALLTGIATNIYITVIMVFVGAYSALFSPLLGVVVFVCFFILLKKDKIQASLSFLIVAYLVAIEIIIHTHFLGWESGFYYFMFLLPTVFLLNSSWNKWIVIFFNISIVIIAAMLWIIYHDKTAIHNITPEISGYINLMNMTGTASVVIFIMIYFRQTIHKKEEALVDANVELERQNNEISGQHKHLQVLLKEVHHRVKNNLQIISSLMSLQRHTVADEKIITILDESKRRVEAIALIHQKLYQDEKFNQVDFKSYMEELMNSQQTMVADLRCVVDSEDVVLSLDTAVPLGLIVSEMITNSIKHAFEEVDAPELKIKLTRSDGDYELIVHDNGVGLSEDFTLENPISLGTEIINALTEQIGARIKFSNDNGAKFIIYFRN